MMQRMLLQSGLVKLWRPEATGNQGFDEWTTSAMAARFARYIDENPAALRQAASADMLRDIEKTELDLEGKRELLERGLLKVWQPTALAGVAYHAWREAGMHKKLRALVETNPEILDEEASEALVERVEATQPINADKRQSA